MTTAGHTAEAKAAKAVTERDTGAAAEATIPGPNPKLERHLVFVVVLLGLMIVAGLVAVIGRVIYLSSQGEKQPASDAAPRAAAAPLHPAAAAGAVPFTLPAGAEIKSIALDGARLAVHYAAPGGDGILVVDQATGETLSHLKASK